MKYTINFSTREQSIEGEFVDENPMEITAVIRYGCTQKCKNSLTRNMILENMFFKLLWTTLNPMLKLSYLLSQNGIGLPSQSSKMCDYLSYDVNIDLIKNILTRFNDQLEINKKTMRKNALK